jgi:CRP-like cAMP-binding protein
MGSEKSCRHCASFQTSGFDLISTENQVRLDNYKQSRHFIKNEKIFDQGDLVQHVYCLRGGLVKLESVGHDGSAMTLGFVRGGDLLGMGGVLSNQPSTISATAVEDTYACSFSAEFMRQILKDSPELSMLYMSKLFNELRETQQRLLSGVEKEVPSRVAEALIYLKSNYPNHQFTRKEIAEWAGTTTESVIRTLSHFEDEGLIEQAGRHIAISNARALSERAGALI